MSRIKSVFRFTLIAIILVLVIGTIGFVTWANTPQGELMDEVDVALTSDDDVTVTISDWISFEPVDDDVTIGYIFYPGGRVQAEAYAPTARAIAEEGYFTAIVYVPLHLAFFNTNAAQAVIEAHPEIEYWAVGGHSLGGVAASSFAASHPDEVSGLVLEASYPASWDDLATRDDLTVASIYGTNDGLATPNTVLESAASLPANAVFVEIEGGNHGNFGWYGPQPGDNDATIDREEQQKQVVEAVTTVLKTISGEE